MEEDTSLQTGSDETANRNSELSGATVTDDNNDAAKSSDQVSSTAPKVPKDLDLKGRTSASKLHGDTTRKISPTESFDDRFHVIGTPDSADDAVELYFPENPEASSSSDVSKEVMAMYFPDSVDQTDPAVIENLSQGLLAEFLPQLQRSKSTLSEVTENQKILLETLEQENAKFAECQALDDLTALMEKAKIYHAKLVNIKKDMAMIRDKTNRMKKTAVKLQQQKQKEALQREFDKDRELDKERQLIAKPVKKSGR